MRLERDSTRRARVIGIACALALSGFAQVSGAQLNEPSTSPTGSAAPGTVAPTAPPPEHAAPPVVVSDKARRHFLAGVLLLEDPQTPRYEEAYREFNTAYRDSPSYKILGNLGLCAMKLERDAEAIAAFERYLHDGGSELDAQERSQVERDLTTLRAGIVEIDVTSNPPGARLTDVRTPVQGPQVTNVYGPMTTETLKLGARQGHHRLTGHLPGYPDVVWEFDAEGGDVRTKTFEFRKPPAPKAVVGLTRHVRPVPLGVYVGAGVTGALLIGGTVTGVLALHQKDLFDQDNDGLHRDQARSAANAGRTFNIVTDCLFGAAVVSAGITTYVYLSRPGHDEPIRMDPMKAKVDVVPTLGRGGGGLSLRGAF